MISPVVDDKITVGSNLDSPRVTEESADTSILLSKWPVVSGLENLESQNGTDWINYNCPDELKEIGNNPSNDLRRIALRSLALDLYKETPTDGRSSVASSSTGSQGRSRPRTGLDLSGKRKDDSASLISRLSIISTPDGSHSPESPSKKSPFGWLTDKNSKDTRGFRFRLKDRRRSR